VSEIYEEFSLGDGGIRFRPSVAAPPPVEDRPISRKHGVWRDEALRKSGEALLKCKYEFNWTP
jgi:hypothetical protein